MRSCEKPVLRMRRRAGVDLVTMYDVVTYERAYYYAHSVWLIEDGSLSGYSPPSTVLLALSKGVPS